VAPKSVREDSFGRKGWATRQSGCVRARLQGRWKSRFWSALYQRARLGSCRNARFARIRRTSPPSTSEAIGWMISSRAKSSLPNAIKKGTFYRQWVSDSLNWKAKVVCKTCNETWMSEIESKHAKPSMTDLIRLRWPLVIDEKRANSLAIFAFKTAVVFDHVARNRPPFFSRSARRQFRRHLAVPPMVRMWMAASSGLRRGSVLTGRRSAYTRTP